MDVQVEMKAAVKKDGCCRKKDDRKAVCKPAPEKASAKKHCNKDEEKKCGKPANTACVCICCFQFAAPDQLGSRIQFGVSASAASLNEYMALHWKDPMLSLPWQPPDQISIV